MSGSGKSYGVIIVACSGILIVQDGTTTGCKRYDSMEGIGRVESGTETESNAGAVATSTKPTKKRFYKILTSWALW